METYVVRLTKEQVTLLRKLVSERAMLVHAYPTSEDGDLESRLHEVDRVLHKVSQSF